MYWQSETHANLFEGLRKTCFLCRAIAIAATLSGCASFSSDGGMSVAAGIAAQELEKDTVAIRTPEDATSARTRVCRSAQAAIDCRRGRADRAPQQPRPPSGL